jgi:RPA family protein
MDKILDREIAWRIFAHEFNRSNMHISEGDERAPNYIITPTGVKCNRLFIVGVATEVENIGKDNNLWRARVADPTGVFTVYAGQYQPEAAIFLSGLNIPAYVAIVGKARKYEPEDGSVYTSVRPEEMNDADEMLRDRWVLNTAQRTLERIRLVEDSLKSGLSGNELKEYLHKKRTKTVQIDGVAKAIEHYRDLDKMIAELKKAVIHAIGTVADGQGGQAMTQAIDKRNEPQMKASIIEPIEGISPMKKEPKELIADIIDKLDTGKGVSYSKVVEAAQKMGINSDSIESGIKELMDEGRCYELKIGVLRKVG